MNNSLRLIFSTKSYQDFVHFFPKNLKTLKILKINIKVYVYVNTTSRHVALEAFRNGNFLLKAKKNSR